MKINELFLTEAPQWPKTKEEILARLKSDYVYASDAVVNDDLTVSAYLFSLNAIHVDVENKPEKTGPGRKTYSTKMRPFSGKYLPFKLKDVGTFNINAANNLMTLEGCPETVGGFSIRYAHNLTSLDFLPKEIEGDIHISNCKRLTSLGKFPTKANEDVYIVNCPSLNSLVGLPSHVTGDVVIRNAPAVTKNHNAFEGLPSFIGGDLLIDKDKIISLVGINDHLKHLSGNLEIEWEDIKEGGLGLILIEGIKDKKQIWHGNFSTQEIELPPFKALSIIMKYVGRPNDIYDCQMELIDMGLEEYAKL